MGQRSDQGPPIAPYQQKAGYATENNVGIDILGLFVNLDLVLKQ